MAAIHSIQFCDSTQNLDITGSPSRERDADEVRVWSSDGTLIVSVGKYDHGWRISGSDCFQWQTWEDDYAFREPRGAITHALDILEIPVAELDEAL
jgi:hypothetical protein